MFCVGLVFYMVKLDVIKGKFIPLLPSINKTDIKSATKVVWKTFDCDSVPESDQQWQMNCAKLFTTLGLFLSSKNLTRSAVRSELSLGSWAAEIGPVCISRDRRLLTFSSISIENSNIAIPNETDNSYHSVENVKRTYWNDFIYHWKVVYNESERTIAEKNIFILGRTFITLGDSGNIGHCLQRLSCDAAASIGAKSWPFNVTLNFDPIGEDIASFVVRAIGDSLVIMQSPVPLIRFDGFRHAQYICFERVTFQRPQACGPHGLLRFPSNHKATLATVRSALFARMNLSRKVASQDSRTMLPCIKHILLYDRNNTGGRRFLNARKIHDFLNVNRCLNVTMIHDIPAAANAQASLINSADLFITPHGATAYLSFFLPDSAWLIEIGMITWVKDALMPFFPLSYKFVNVGLNLLPYDDQFDRRGPRESERSFILNDTAINTIQALIHSHSCSCS